jgi:hypothetical protein
MFRRAGLLVRSIKPFFIFCKNFAEAYLQQDFAEELFDLGTWTLDADSLCFTRTQWAFVETLRR